MTLTSVAQSDNPFRAVLHCVGPEGPIYERLPSPWPKATHVFSEQLTGLDSVKFIRAYFEKRKIELSNFEPDHALVNDPDVNEATRAPKLIRRGHDEFLIYHPNAADDGKDARVDGIHTENRTATINPTPKSGFRRFPWDGNSRPSEPPVVSPEEVWRRVAIIKN